MISGKQQDTCYEKHCNNITHNAHVEYLLILLISSLVLLSLEYLKFSEKAKLRLSLHWRELYEII